MSFTTLLRLQRKCVSCTRTQYEHIDHAHAMLTRSGGPCPFGDCGSFAAADE